MRLISILETSRFARRTMVKILLKTKTLTSHVDPNSNDKVVTLLVSRSRKAAPKLKKFRPDRLKIFFGDKAKMAIIDIASKMVVAFR